MFVGVKSNLQSFNVEFHFKDMSIRLIGETHSITASLDGQLSLRLRSPQDIGKDSIRSTTTQESRISGMKHTFV